MLHEHFRYWPIASLRCPQQFGRFRSEADIETNRSGFMDMRRSRCPAWFRAAQPEREEGNNELRTDDRLEIFLHFFAELVVKGGTGEKKNSSRVTAF
jgi:hypothetical protein